MYTEMPASDVSLPIASRSASVMLAVGSSGMLAQS